MVTHFDAEHASTDDRALLLKAMDERLTLTEDLTACLPDRAGAGPHKLLTVLGQSVPGVTDGGDLCLVAGVAATGPRHELRLNAHAHVVGATTKMAVWVARLVRRIVLYLPCTASGA